MAEKRKTKTWERGQTEYVAQVRFRVDWKILCGFSDGLYKIRVDFSPDNFIMLSVVVKTYTVLPYVSFKGEM